MLRILHYGLGRNIGGIETYLKKLVANIDGSKFRIDFIDTNVGYPAFYEYFNEYGCEFYKVTPRRNSILKHRREIDKLFSHNSFDILHCHFNTLSYFYIVKSALKHNVKVIVHSRNSGISNSIVTNVLHFLNKIHFSMTNNTYNVAVSDIAGVWMFGKKPFKIINNGIEISKYKFDHSIRRLIRKRMNVTDKYVVGHIGAFLYAKNHQFVLRVYKELLKLNNNVILILIGDGPLKSKIIKKVKKMKLEASVLFLGKIDDVRDYLNVMDHMILPSFYEGFPNVVLEAQTSGVPITISENITNEIVVNDNCNKFNIKNSRIWASHINQSLALRSERTHAYKKVENHGFSVENEMYELENLYITISNDAA